MNLFFYSLRASSLSVLLLVVLESVVDREYQQQRLSDIKPLSLSTAETAYHINMDLAASYGSKVAGDDINGLNTVLIEYLKALTDVCKLGILLAGKLDRQLQCRHACHMRTKMGCNQNGPDRKVMTHIGSFYSGIMGKMGPLWEQTICDSSDGGESGSADSANDGSSRLSQQQFQVSEQSTRHLFYALWTLENVV